MLEPLQVTYTTLESINRDIARAHRLVALVIAAAIALYVIWFWAVLRQPLSESSDAWGVFGDFVGGLLNPLVAYAAFYWLTKSVLLQKEELSETRKALADASTAQATQAVHAHASVRLNALTALTSSIMSEVQTHRVHLQYLVQQITPTNPGGRALDGAWVTQVELLRMIAHINGWIESRMKERNEFEQQIKHILECYQVEA